MINLRMVLALDLLTFCLPCSLQADVVIEGTVKLPPSKAPAAAAARYQQKAGAVAAPSPPVAVVYLEGSFTAKGSSSSAPAEMGQKDYQFMPGTVVVRRGSQIVFPNHDDDYHHVFSYSKTKEFDVGRYRKGETTPSVTFDKAGVVRVGCEIHEHMRAYILVLDTPHFATTDAAGKYRLELKNVPDGKYTFKAWVNEKTTWEQPVELKDGAKLQVDFPNK